MRFTGPRWLTLAFLGYTSVIAAVVYALCMWQLRATLFTQVRDTEFAVHEQGSREANRLMLDDCGAYLRNPALDTPPLYVASSTSLESEMLLGQMFGFAELRVELFDVAPRELESSLVVEALQVHRSPTRCCWQLLSRCSPSSDVCEHATLVSGFGCRRLNQEDTSIVIFTDDIPVLHGFGED